MGTLMTNASLKVYISFELRNSISYKIVCVPSRDSDQPAHLPSLISLLVCLERLWILAYPQSSSQDSDQTLRMSRLVRFYTEHTCNLVGNAVLKPFEPAHDKIYKMACAPTEDSDQPGHLPSLISLCCVLNR